METSSRRPPEGASAEDHADWAALRTELETFVAAPAVTWVGGSFQASVAVYETLGLLWMEFSGSRRARRQAEQKRREQAELEAVTYEVQLWRGTKFAPAHRVARASVDEWFSRAGHTVKSEPFKVQARGSFDDDAQGGHPSGGYSITTTQIGAELPEGTVKSKRIVVRDGKRQVEYLIKKRGVRAEHKYRRGVRAKELRHQLEVNADYHTAEQLQIIRAELEALEAAGI